jgi:type I restriction enzyme S subunit
VSVRLPEITGNAGVFVDGDWVESKDQDPNGDVRLVQLADIGDGEFLDKSARFLTSQKAAQLRCTYLQPGDILIARMPDPLGRACVFPEGQQPSVTVVDVCIVRPDLKKVWPRWLLHKINSDSFRRNIHDWTTGTTRQRISRGNLAKISFDLPPLKEQRRIAAILDNADALRRKRKRALELLDTLTQSIFLDMFGDPVVNPRALEKAPLGNLIRVKSGDGLVAKDMVAAGQYPVYGGNGINGYHDEFMFEEQKLVIGRVGVYCGAVHLTRPNSWITDNALYVSEIKRPMSLVYLAAALTLANLNQYAGRAAQPLVSGSRIYPVEILLPSLDDQLRFESALLEISQTTTALNLGTKLLGDLFSSLQHSAFSGQL